jgi:hypothetical protein
VQRVDAERLTDGQDQGHDHDDGREDVHEAADHEEEGIQRQQEQDPRLDMGLDHWAAFAGTSASTR